MKNEVRKKRKAQLKFGVSEIVIFAIIFLLSVVVVVTLASGKDSLNDDSEETNGEVVEKFENNINPGVIEDKELDGLKFTNTALICSETSSKLTTVVQNMTNRDIKVRIFDIFVKDKDGDLIVTLQGYVGGEVPGNNAREIVTNVDMNLIDAYDIEYKLIED